MTERFWVETLGCPKNQVDSDKVTGKLVAEGLAPASAPGEADLLVVNTCAFIEAARQESIDTILALSDQRRVGARLVVTGCMAERYGDELAAELPEADQVAGFGVAFGLDAADRSPEDATAAAPLGRSATAAPDALESVPVTIGTARPPGSGVPDFDLLKLPRPRSEHPWAYLKIAEGCDRACGFCAIPSFRGKQRSRPIDELLDEVDQLDVQEVVLVAQDLASFGRDQGRGQRGIVALLDAVSARVPWVRCLYLYPSDLDDTLIDAILATGVPYFDLSLQHVSPSLLRGMRRWGDGDRFLRRIADIRRSEPTAAFRSNFIVGYPGETEDDHDQLLAFVEEARVDWCGFFAYSEEAGTHAAGLDGAPGRGLVDERLAELRELQDAITAEKRDEIIGSTVRVLVDETGKARSHREAPEIDGIIVVPDELTVGGFSDVLVTNATGPDLHASRPQDRPDDK